MAYRGASSSNTLLGRHVESMACQRGFLFDRGAPALKTLHMKHHRFGLALALGGYGVVTEKIFHLLIVVVSFRDGVKARVVIVVEHVRECERIYSRVLHHELRVNGIIIPRYRC